MIFFRAWNIINSRLEAANLCEETEAEGYEDVRLIDTADGTLMGKKEAAWLGLSGSTLFVGKK